MTCCNHDGSGLFPCNRIPNDTSIEGEKAFSTAFYTSWYFHGYGCLGLSRFCEWDSRPEANIYDLSPPFVGSCGSKCTEYCNNYSNYSSTNDPYPNGCFKCYGVYPGFYDPADLYYTPSWYRRNGPCTKDNEPRSTSTAP